MSENENNQYRLLSPWAYVGYGILFTLPVIGWILAIVFALTPLYFDPLIIPCDIYIENVLQ